MPRYPGAPRFFRASWAHWNNPNSTTEHKSRNDVFNLVQKCQLHIIAVELFLCDKKAKNYIFEYIFISFPFLKFCKNTGIRGFHIVQVFRWNWINLESVEQSESFPQYAEYACSRICQRRAQDAWWEGPDRGWDRFAPFGGGGSRHPTPQSRCRQSLRDLGEGGAVSCAVTKCEVI